MIVETITIDTIKVTTQEDTIKITSDHLEDERLVMYTYTTLDGNVSINESIENETQEVNIPFEDLFLAMALMQKYRKCM